MSAAQDPLPIEECLAAIASCGNAAAVDAARALVQSILGLHRLALSRMLELVQRGGGSAGSLLEELAGDDLVSNLLLLHDLHPIGLERRLATALGEAAPRLAELGGRVAAYTVEQGVIEVHVADLQTGPATMAARLIVEELVVKHVPDAAGLRFTGTVPPREPGSYGQGHGHGQGQGQGQGQGLITLRIPRAAQKGPGPQS